MLSWRNTMTREERSIKILESFEPKNGYHLAFSGGKDSQVLYDICLKAGVKFTAYFCRTSVDPPEVISFIKENYPDVIFLKPKLTMYQLILQRKALPTRIMRFCCEVLKEYAGSGQIVLTGIRSAESNNRKLRPQIEMDKSKFKLFIHPIKDWSDNQVWNYLKKNKIDVNILYKEGYGRIGCIGCPMASTKAKFREFERFPKHKVAYIKTIEKLMTMGKYNDFENAEDVFNWWVSNDSKNAFMAEKDQGKLNFT